MKKCPFCNADIEESARFCLYCMQSLTEKEEIIPYQKNKLQRLIIVALVIIVLLLALTVAHFARQTATESEISTENPYISAATSDPTVSSDASLDMSLDTSSDASDDISSDVSTDTSTDTSSDTSVDTSTDTPSDTSTDTSADEPSDTEPQHTHSYSVENINLEYQKEAATCRSPAIYYYSCHCGEKGTKTFYHGALAEHIIVTDEGYPASCIKSGLTDGSHCSVCDIVLLAQTQIPTVSHTFDNSKDDCCNVCNYVRVLNCNHSKTTAMPAVSPTCTAAGLTEGKKCVACEEILTMQVNIAPFGHIQVIDQAVSPTCTVAGKTEGRRCAFCNEILTAQTDIEPLGHIEVTLKAIAPTCTTSGKTEGKKCNVCKAILTEQIDIKPSGHTEAIDKAVLPTCTTDGKTEGKHCSVCKAVLVYQQTIPATGHTFDPYYPLLPCSDCGAKQPHTHNYSEENAKTEYLKKAADCLGSAVYYYSCICGEKGTKTFSYGAKGGHTVVTDVGYAPTCTTDGLSDGSHCSVCNTVLEAQQEIIAVGHTYAPSNELPSCLDCGEKGPIIVTALDFPIVVADDYTQFQIDSLTYHVKLNLSRNMCDIYINLNCTNTSSAIVEPCPSASILFYDSGGEKETYSLSCDGHTTLKPNKSGVSKMYCNVPLLDSAYTLIFRGP